MKPRVALNLKLRAVCEYTNEEIEAARDEWVNVYAATAESYPEKKEMCQKLTERICRAAELFATDAEEQVESLDGDFPLGNEADMRLASPFFSLEELALLQVGYAERIEPEQEWRKAETNYARKGVLADFKGLYKEAAELYREHCEASRYPDDYVRLRYKEIDERLGFQSTSAVLLKRAAEYMDKDMSMDFLSHEFYSYAYLRRVMKTEEEKAITKKCELQLTECYQKALERNYEKIEEYKKSGSADFEPVWTWTLTFDENGNFVKTTVLGLDERAERIYAGNCKEERMKFHKSFIKKYRDGLHEKIKEFDLTPAEKRAWFDDDFDPYELRASALGLKQKTRLGGDSNPSYNYDLSGLTGGRLDAAAWQNYAIANGLVRPHTDYDELLDDLIRWLNKSIEAYEKAILYF